MSCDNPNHEEIRCASCGYATDATTVCGRCGCDPVTGEKEAQRYLVSWCIEVDAHNPREAAETAHDMMPRGDSADPSIATCFGVRLLDSDEPDDGRLEESIELEPTKFEPQAPAMNPRELATVLAALRYWQDQVGGGPVPSIVREHFGSYLLPLTNPEIDALCERLNTAPEPEVTIFVRGGIAEGYETSTPMKIKVHDYDVEAADPEFIKRDAQGDEYTETEL